MLGRDSKGHARAEVAAAGEWGQRRMGGGPGSQLGPVAQEMDGPNAVGEAVIDGRAQDHSPASEVGHLFFIKSTIAQCEAKYFFIKHGNNEIKAEKYCTC